MKKLLCIVLLSMVGCDGQKSAPQYPPPTIQGTGTIMFFDVNDQHGNNVFNESLSSYFREHPQYRFDGMVPIEHNQQNQPTKFMVIVQTLNNESAPLPKPLPTTLPTINEKGEIDYPQ